jgi:hypothetical protein
VASDNPGGKPLLADSKSQLPANYLNYCEWLAAHAWLSQNEFEMRLILALLAMLRLLLSLVGVLLHFLV